MKRFFLSMTTLMCLVLVSVPAKAENFTDAQKAEITEMMKSYIQDHPGEIIDALNQHQIDQQKEALKEADGQLNNHADYLLSDPRLPRAGNPDGDVNIVEFYDYSCGYCKKAFADLQLLLEADKDIQVTLVDMPILGPASGVAAKWGLAVFNVAPEKFFEFHTNVMQFTGEKSDANMKTLAEAIGLDVAAVETEFENPALIETIRTNLSVAKDLSIQGTPGFVINGEIYRGYLGYEELKNVVDKAREKTGE